MAIQPGRQFRDTSGFKRIELAPQDPREVRKVVAAGEERSKAKRRMSDSEYEGQLRDLAAQEKAASRAESASMIATTSPARDQGVADYPAMSKRQQAHLEGMQRAFESSPAGPAKEKARGKIGRAIQSAVPASGGSLSRLACQTPNCNESVDLVRGGGDVVCEGCLSKGDKAGATYKDRPENVVSTVKSDSRRVR